MRSGAVAVTCLSLACAALAGACDDVTPERVAEWKSTEKGPRKLEGALGNGGLAPDLRAQAAVALIEIGRGEAVDAALAAMPVGERAAVVPALVPRLTALLEQAGTGARAVDARDGLFALRAYAGPAEQQKVDAVLLQACARDLRAGRYAGGRHSVHKILTALGPAAGALLVRLLEEPASPFPAIVEVLVKVGDAPTRDRAGQALVARAAALPEVPLALWRAIGAVGGKAGQDFLKGKIAGGGEEQATLAARALQQGQKDPALVPFALKVAADHRAPKSVREEMFGVLEHLGGAEAVDGLVRIIGGDPDERVRYRAYEAAVAVGKADALGPALAALPAGATYKREDVVDFLVKDVEKLGAAARPALVKLLAAPAPLARLTAVLALEKLGTAAEAPALQALAGDRAAPKGFPPGGAVGAEAARVAGVLRAKSGGKP